MSLVSLENVSVSYGQLKALDGVTCKIDEPGAIGLLGHRHLTGALRLLGLGRGRRLLNLRETGAGTDVLAYNNLISAPVAEPLFSRRGSASSRLGLQIGGSLGNGR